MNTAPTICIPMSMYGVLYRGQTQNRRSKPMRAVRLLLKAFAARWKNRRNMGFLIVLIIVMISTFCYVRKQEPQSLETGKIVLGVAKEDSSEYADMLLTYFNENEEFLAYVELVEAEELKLRQALEAGNLDAYLVIPENFAQSMIQMENLPITARVSMENPTKALILRHVMEAYETYIEAVEVNCTALYRLMKEKGFSNREINAANVEISMDLIFTALGKDDFFRKRIVETEGKETLSLMEHYQYTLVYFVLLFSFVPAGLRVISLRSGGMTGRLKTVNVSTGSVLTAVGLPYLLLSVFLVAGVLFVKGNPDGILKALALTVPWLVIFLLLGLFCRDDKQYLFVCSMILVCLAVFGGSLIPEEFLPDSFRKIAEWMPNRNFTYVMGGVQP